MQKKILNDEMKSRINIDFDDTTLIPQLIGVNNCNLREIEDYINVEVDSNGSIIKPVSYTHLTLPTIYSV